MTKDERQRILLVDDIPGNVLALADFLSENYNISMATSGQEALDFVENEAVDLILLDVVMPEMSGHEACVRLKSSLKTKNIPIIFITVKASPEDIIRGFECGASYYLNKPYNEKIVSVIVKQALAENLSRRRLLEEVKQTVGTFGLINVGCFSFKTLDEANRLATLLASACPDPEKRVLGLKELFFNAVEHGNLGITYDDKTQLNETDEWETEVVRRLSLPEYQSKYASVHFERHLDNISFLIKDQGNGFNWKSFIDLDPQRMFHTHGRGIAMARLYSFGEIFYRGNGSEVMALIFLDEKLRP